MQSYICEEWARGGVRQRYWVTAKSGSHVLRPYGNSVYEALVSYVIEKDGEEIVLIYDNGTNTYGQYSLDDGLTWQQTPHARWYRFYRIFSNLADGHMYGILYDGANPRIWLIDDLFEGNVEYVGFAYPADPERVSGTSSWHLDALGRLHMTYSATRTEDGCGVLRYAYMDIATLEWSVPTTFYERPDGLHGGQGAEEAARICGMGGTLFRIWENKENYVIPREDYPSQPARIDTIGNLYYEYSFDRGQTWTRICLVHTYYLFISGFPSYSNGDTLSGNLVVTTSDNALYIMFIYRNEVNNVRDPDCICIWQAPNAELSPSIIGELQRWSSANTSMNNTLTLLDPYGTAGVTNWVGGDHYFVGAKGYNQSSVYLTDIAGLADVTLFSDILVLPRAAPYWIEWTKPSASAYGFWW